MPCPFASLAGEFGGAVDAFTDLSISERIADGYPALSQCSRCNANRTVDITDKAAQLTDLPRDEQRFGR